MRDGAKLARQGIPAIALVTERFVNQGDFVARSVGLPDIPRVRLPHPVAGTGKESLRAIAQATAPQILEAWKTGDDGA
ncbi:MAG: hypothetical protein GWO22_12210 [Actinobacteria bacterium]|nr:hypothetical protein [Actinomycetota bacterium]